MRILLTNDDGIESEGLRVLACAMRAHGDVVVVAPDSDYSGSGAAIGPIHLMDPKVQTGHVDGVDESWAVSGPPALCVLLANLGAFGPVDWVVSGINPGANVGRTVYHSGTIGAVLTGRNGGIPGLAVSQVVPGFGSEKSPADAKPPVKEKSLGENQNGESNADEIRPAFADRRFGNGVVHKWDAAAEVASVALRALIDSKPDSKPASKPDSKPEPQPEPVIVNLNVPNCDVSEMAGWRFTSVGTQPVKAIENVKLEPHPYHPEAFRVNFQWGHPLNTPTDTDTDTEAVLQNYVSVSLLSRLHALDTSSGAGEAAVIGDPLAVSNLRRALGALL